ncbi:hypothetical protein F5H01DRAFT_86350 [Linnemannia elongata]|nr:hypothetical protein F5H01DRAFT_86350 [Linnemannia elongata]
MLSTLFFLSHVVSCAPTVPRKKNKLSLESSLMLLLSVFLVRELPFLSSLHQTYSVRLETQRHSLLHFISFASIPCFP